jgi:hypothetical protein
MCHDMVAQWAITFPGKLLHILPHLWMSVDLREEVLGLIVGTATLGLDPFPSCRWLTGNSPPNPKTNKGTVVNLYLPCWVPRTAEQTVT